MNIEWEAAERNGAKFYENRAAANQDEHRDVEYPPLLVWLTRIPSLLVPNDRDGTEYNLTCQGLLLLTDLVVVLLGTWLAQRLYPGEATPRVIIYLLTTLALFPVLLGTPDLVVGLVVMIALGLLLTGRHPVWSLAALALGFGLKVGPIAAAPVWIIGTLPSDSLHRSVREVVRLLAGRVALFVGLCAACIAPFVLMDGPGAVGFVRYNGNRGIERESVAATVLRAVDQPTEGVGAYGCLEIHSPHSASVVRAVPLIAAIALLGLSILLVRAVRRDHELNEGGGTLASDRPQLFAGFALLFLMTFNVTNKVFSPQFLLWTFPLAVLVPLTGWRYRIFTSGIVLVCILTTLECGMFAWLNNPILTWVPHILTARNLLFVFLTVFLSLSLRSTPQKSPSLHPIAA